MTTFFFSTPRMGFYQRRADVNQTTSFPPAPVSLRIVLSVIIWKTEMQLRLGVISTESCCRMGCPRRESQEQGHKREEKTERKEELLIRAKVDGLAKSPGINLKDRNT